MSNNSLKDIEKIVNSSLTSSINSSIISFDQLTLDAEVENLYSIILFLKTDKKCMFRQLIDIAGVDNPDNEKRFRIVLFIVSLKYAKKKIHK